MIDPEFWRDDKLGSMDMITRFVFVSTWTFADDCGIYEENYTKMRAVMFPYDTRFNIEKHINSLIELGFIEVYEVEGRNYHKIKNFDKFQKINHPTPSESKKILESSGTLKRIPPQVKLREVKLSKDKLREDKTDNQLVVLAYKQAKGFEENDKDWDKHEFGRCSKSAKSLLELLETVDNCILCIKELKAKMAEAKPKPLSWTLETVCRYALDFKKDLKSRNAEETAQKAALEATRKWEIENGIIGAV